MIRFWPGRAATPRSLSTQTLTQTQADTRQTKQSLSALRERPPSLASHLFRVGRWTSCSPDTPQSRAAARIKGSRSPRPRSQLSAPLVPPSPRSSHRLYQGFALDPEHPCHASCVQIASGRVRRWLTSHSSCLMADGRQSLPASGPPPGDDHLQPGCGSTPARRRRPGKGERRRRRLRWGRCCSLARPCPRSRVPQRRGQEVVAMAAAMAAAAAAMAAVAAGTESGCHSSTLASQRR